MFAGGIYDDRRLKLFSHSRVCGWRQHIVRAGKQLVCSRRLGLKSVTNFVALKQNIQSELQCTISCIKYCNDLNSIAIDGDGTDWIFKDSTFSRSQFLSLVSGSKPVVDSRGNIHYTLL